MDEEQPVTPPYELEVVPRARERAHLGLRLGREEVAAHPRRPEDSLQLEAVVADGVAVRDHRVELVRKPERLRHSPSTCRVRSATVSGSKSWTRRLPAATSASRRS